MSNLAIKVGLFAVKVLSVLVQHYLYNKQMIKEAEKIDTIKLYVQTISKLKKNEEINLTNKLLSTEFHNITNKTIKLMLEIEFLHYEQLSSL